MKKKILSFAPSQTLLSFLRLFPPQLSPNFRVFGTISSGNLGIFRSARELLQFSSSAAPPSKLATFGLPSLCEALDLEPKLVRFVAVEPLLECY
jgi:hypothetical protein